MALSRRFFFAKAIAASNARNIHLQNAVDFAKHAEKKVKDYPEAPVVIMGDFNALEDWKSTKLYLGEEVQENGKKFKSLEEDLLVFTSDFLLFVRCCNIM